jgi:hypothetical protein
LLAILVPTLEKIIPLVGATAGMLLAFVFPALIETLTFGPVLAARGKQGKWNWPLTLDLSKNMLLVALGIFGLIAGLQSNIRNLMHDDS